MNVNIYWLLITNWLITNHLGINPIKGGKPPKDKKFNNKVNFKIFDEKNKENICFKWKILNILNINNKFNERNE